RFGRAAHTGACKFGAQCPETCRLWAAARPAPRRNSVIPPHLVTSSCRQSTAPAVMSAAESASDQLYSPAATSGRTCRRIAASPDRSCEDTGSSNQVTPQASSSAATRTACPVVYPPLASTYSSASG